MATFALPGVATSRAAAPSSVAVASSSAVPASTSAAAPPAAASSSARPTSTAAAAAPATSSAAAAPASSSAAAPAASTSSVAAAAAPAASSSAVAPASSSQAAASSSSAAPSSSSVSASSSSVSRLASSTSSASASRSSSSASIAIIDSSSSTSDTGTRTLSGGTIGAIAGGVAGGLVLIALVWTCWRRIKARRERVPPPPPRDMSYNPHSIRRSNLANMLESGLAPGVGMGRQSSYAALLHNTPSEQVSRQPSYYTTYPIATPSTDGSPLNISPEFNPIEDPSLIGAGAGVSAAGMAGIGAGGLVAPGPASPRDTRPRTADSDGPISPQRMSRRIPSVDRLRLEAAGLPIPSDRAPSPSPSTLQFPSPRPAPYPIIEHSPLHSGDITPPSPSVSSTGHPSRSSSSPLLNQGYRPGSMSSLSSRNYLHVGPARGAPHQGRPVQLEMPKPLAKGGDMGDGMGLGSPLAQAGEWKRNSGGPSDFMPYNPNQHRRMPSGQSVSGNSAQSRPRTSQSYAQGLGGTNPGQASPRTMSGGPRPASGPQQ